MSKGTKNVVGLATLGLAVYGGYVLSKRYFFKRRQA